MSANIRSNHYLILRKIKLHAQLKKRPKPVCKEKLNIKLLRDQSIKNLYQTKLKQKIRNSSILEEDDVETSWRKVEEQIKKAVSEALGTRKVNMNSNRKNTPWFMMKVKQLTKEKRKAFLQYLNNRTPEKLQKYKKMKNRIKTRRKKRESFTADMEHDIYGAHCQKKNLGNDMTWEAGSERMRTSTINREAWTDYFRRFRILW